MVSAQLLELLFFAAIAFLIISKLIATLGTTSDEENAKRKSYFGEVGSLKDVTETAISRQANAKNNITSAQFNNNLDIDDLITKDNRDAIINGIFVAQEKIRSFNPATFIKSSRLAFTMIIQAALTQNQKELEALVDKRYIDFFLTIAPSYSTADNKNLTAKISEVYTFGNTVFVKILFTGKNITSKAGNFREEWTFSKSSNSSGSEWYLANIDRPQ